MIEYAGYVAAFLTTASFIPQAWKSIKTRSTAGISLVMYAVFCLGIFLWLAYGLFRGDYPLILANSLTLFFSVIILWIKAQNVLRGKETV